MDKTFPYGVIRVVDSTLVALFKSETEAKAAASQLAQANPGTAFHVVAWMWSVTADKLVWTKGLVIEEPF